MTDDISRIMEAARMLKLANIANGKIKLKEKKEHVKFNVFSRHFNCRM